MRKILCLLTFLAAISCEYEIEIRTDPDETGRILIQSLAGLGDTTVVYVDATLPVGSPDTVDLGLMRVRLKADGKDVFLHRNHGVSRTFPDEAFFTTEKFEPGCRLDVEASHPELPSANASTVVPDAFPDYIVELDEVDIDLGHYLAMSAPNSGGWMGDPEAMRVRLTFTDEASSRDYYAVWIFRGYYGIYDRAEYYVNHKSYQSLSVNMDSHPMLVQLFYTFGDAAYMRSHDCLVAFSDVDFDGEKVTKEFLVPYYPGDKKFTYHMDLIRMSPECWRCVEADFNMIMNDFAEYGQAAIYPYTNVIGGIGAFGAISPITSMDLVM